MRVVSGWCQSGVSVVSGWSRDADCIDQKDLTLGMFSRVDRYLCMGRVFGRSHIFAAEIVMKASIFLPKSLYCYGAWRRGVTKLSNGHVSAANFTVPIARFQKTGVVISSRHVSNAEHASILTDSNHTLGLI